MWHSITTTTVILLTTTVHILKENDFVTVLSDNFFDKYSTSRKACVYPNKFNKVTVTSQ